MIEDLDGVVDPRPSWRDRWLLPLAAGLLLATVLATSFVRPAPAARPLAVGPAAPAAPARVLAALPGAPALRILELPRTVAMLEARTQFSGTTGLTSAGDSDGQRDVYRLPDGRLLVVIQYPDPAAVRIVVRGAPGQPSVRGVPAERVVSDAASLPLAVAWTAEGMRYQVGGAGFTLEELQRYAELLR